MSETSFTSYDEYRQSKEFFMLTRADIASELAWNAAVYRMKDLLKAAHESGIDDWFVTLEEELDQLDTGFRDAGT